jgi:hypothetical protein
LTKTEWDLFQSLVRSETYCSYATLLRSEGTFADHHYRSTLYRLKKQLKPFSLTVVGVGQVGYILLSLPAPMPNGALL